MMKSKSTFAQSEIQDGDIICFQVEMNEKEYVFMVNAYGFSNILLVERMILRRKECTRTPFTSMISCKTES